MLKNAYSPGIIIANRIECITVEKLQTVHACMCRTGKNAGYGYTKSTSDCQAEHKEGHNRLFVSDGSVILYTGWLTVHAGSVDRNINR